MADWAGHARQALDSGTPCALISLLAVEGSAPREAGTRMVVTPDACLGTIGGGNLEFLAIRQARAVLDRPPGTWRIQDYPLGPLLGQCCGGRVRVMVERLEPLATTWLREAEGLAAFGLETRLYDGHVERRVVVRAEAAMTARGPQPAPGDRLVEAVGRPLVSLVMFGAGHVGQAIARLMPGLPFDLAWSDNRPDYAVVAHLRTADDMAAQAREATGAVLILTHDHALDYRLTAAVLSGPAAFVGLIGSATKHARFLSRLRKDGFDDATLARLTCPIGMPGIVGKAPEVIAVSVVAQLLLLTQGGADGGA